MVKRLIESDISFLENIPWFSNMNNISSDAGVLDAVKMIDSDEWENFQLDRSGDISEYLSCNHRAEYNEWNDITSELQAYLESNVFPTLKDKLREHDLPLTIFPSIQWDILSYLQEKTYESFGVPKFYYLVLESYQNGFLPCGWTGYYPEGKLLQC
ncbi:hypothetical protein [Celerinatantimonas sp. MCCC 1A17872]|uniref:hypothetical protein n=1 Tax=Celerinatantimonas sp. MCCC 1A17872 TaxID=3177514 RepID=UPI0038C23B66